MQLVKGHKTNYVSINHKAEAWDCRLGQRSDGTICQLLYPKELHGDNGRDRQTIPIFELVQLVLSPEG